MIYCIIVTGEKGKELISLHYVYIVRCQDNTLYTGYTTDIDRRIAEHNQGIGAKYTRGRLPVSLEYVEEYQSKSQALSREYEIKAMKRIDKLKLLESWGER